MIKDHRGDTFVGELNSWRIDYRLFKERRKREWSLRQSLSTPFYEKTTVFDHHGNVFESEAEMCEAYSISHYTYTARIKRGWNREEALTVEPYKSDQMQSILMK